MKQIYQEVYRQMTTAGLGADSVGSFIPTSYPEVRI
jgi:hypothetical protein